MGRMIEYTRTDGQRLQAYLAEADPVAGPVRGAVVLCQEWWGLNAYMRDVAERHAQAGFHALVPDLYHGQITTDPIEAQDLMIHVIYRKAAAQELRGAVCHLKERLHSESGKVAIVGYSSGSALALLTLCASPEVDAGVLWYGYPPLEYMEAERITAPVLAHWADEDAFFRQDFIRDHEALLRSHGVRYTGYHYPAPHAFANETAQGPGPGRMSQMRYDPAWARIAWDRTMAFLGAELRPERPLRRLLTG